MKHRAWALAGLLVGALTLNACAGSGCGATATGSATTGPIQIWYSNNAQEVAWGTQAVAAWNKVHPDQIVSALIHRAGCS